MVWEGSLKLTKHIKSDIILSSSQTMNGAFCFYSPGISQQRLWANRPHCVALPSVPAVWFDSPAVTQWGWFVMAGNLWRPRICRNCQSEYVPLAANQVCCCRRCYQVYREKEIRRIGRFLILERDEFRCIYCGLSSVEEAAQLHVDHIIPRASGGEDIAKNLITACARCNLEKSHRLLNAKNTARLLAEVERRNSECDIEPWLTIKL